MLNEVQVLNEAGHDQAAQVELPRYKVNSREVAQAELMRDRGQSETNSTEFMRVYSTPAIKYSSPKVQIDVTCLVRVCQLFLQVFVAGISLHDCSVFVYLLLRASFR